MGERAGAALLTSKTPAPAGASAGLFVRPVQAPSHRFAGGKRGKFYQAGANLNLPVYLEREVQDRLAALASAKGVEMSTLINELLKKDIELIEIGR